MHLTLVCLLFIVVSTVSARTEYKKISWGAPKVFRYANYAARYANYGRWKPWSTFEQKRDYDASEEEREEVLAEMFLDLDGDQDGLIDIDELSYDMATVLKGETRTPEDLMEETDTNRDGFIDYDEFVDDIDLDSLY